MASTSVEAAAEKAAGEKKPVEEETIPPIPNLALAQARWTLLQPDLTGRHAAAKATLLRGIEADEMAPFLESLAGTVDLGDTASLLTTLKARNTAELKRFDDKIQDAKENLGETDISDLLRQKASYVARIGHNKEAVDAYAAALEKVVGLGSRIDLRLATIRIGFFHGDFSLVSDNIAKAKELIESGGDWDRRNRLKAYEGLYKLAIRDFKAGADLLIDTMATFGATELMPFEDFVAHCIISGIFALERREYKKKVMEAPEVLSVIDELPHLKNYLTALYNTQYAKFFLALADVEQHHLLPNRLLAIHTRYYVREMRIKAYAQLLESYRSVTLASLSSAFGVEEHFLDADLARFIAAGRLNFTIDKINGVVETNRPDARNARYEQVVKQGDSLLNAVQRVARALSATG